MEVNPYLAAQADEVQRLLDHSCSSPEEDLVRLGKAVAGTPETQRFAELRMLVAEIDDLIAQTRWSLGQALLLLQLYPEIEKAGEDDDPIWQQIGLDAGAALLLRGYIANAERVMVADLATSWRGGTVAGWIFHMMIDDAVTRAIAVLDRIARVAFLVAEIREDRVYFRSRKLSRIHDKLQMDETAKLVDIAQSPLYEFLLDYRDGLAHERKVFARMAGYPITASYIDAAGQRVLTGDTGWTAEYLFALGNAAYHQVVLALCEIAGLCEQRLSKSSDRRTGV